MKRKNVSRPRKAKRLVLCRVLLESAIAVMKAQLRPSGGTGVSIRSPASANTSLRQRTFVPPVFSPRRCIARFATPVGSLWVPVVGVVIRSSVCGCLLGNVLDLLTFKPGSCQETVHRFLHSAFAWERLPRFEQMIEVFGLSLRVTYMDCFIRLS